MAYDSRLCEIKKQRQTEPLLHLLQQVYDLGLYRYVKRGRGLVINKNSGRTASALAIYALLLAAETRKGKDQRIQA